MIYNNFRKSLFNPCLLAILALVSCQKEMDPNDPDPIPEEVKDSTLLIKSITQIFHIGLPDEDSITEYYLYDSVNKKVILSWDDPMGLWIPEETKAELSYTNTGLLSHVSYKYRAGYSATTFEDPIRTDITYDADDVLQKIVTEWGNGEVRVMLFNKTQLSSDNYQLNWLHTIAGHPDETIAHKAFFNKEGKNIIDIIDYSSAGPSYPAYIITDSMIYDTGGNISKVYQNITDALMQTSEDHILYEFGSRQTKGDQLYNQHRAVLNGIANIPFADLDDSFGDAFGSILSYYAEKEHFQFSKFPFQSVKAYQPNGSYIDFTGTSAFDNKDRLVKFTGLVHENDFVPRVYKIEYYK